MKLFKNSDIDVATPGTGESHSPKATASSIAIDNSFATGASLDLIETTIGQLRPGASIFFKTDGAWSNIELLEYILAQTGPADVYFTTWSISAEAITRFTSWQQRGVINDLVAILDSGIRNRKPEIYQQATGAFRKLKTAACHAKVTVIRSDNHHITLMGSANYTKNPRIETGVIILSEDLAEANIYWILEVLNG